MFIDRLRCNTISPKWCDFCLLQEKIKMIELALMNFPVGNTEALPVQARSSTQVASLDQQRFPLSNSRIVTPVRRLPLPVTARLKACFRAAVSPESTISLLHDRSKCAHRRFDADKLFYTDHGLPSPPRLSYFKRREWLGVIEVNTKNAPVNQAPAADIFDQLKLAVASDHLEFEDWKAVTCIVKACDQHYLSSALNDAPIGDLNAFLARSVARLGRLSEGDSNVFDTLKRLISCMDAPLLSRLMVHAQQNSFKGNDFLHVLSACRDPGVMDYFLQTVGPHLSSVIVGDDGGLRTPTLGDRLLNAMVRYVAKPETIQCVLKLGCNPNAKDENGQTAVHGLAQSPWHNECNVSRTEAILDLLINHEADLNSVDNNGQTPLMLAVMKKVDRQGYLRSYSVRGAGDNRLVKALLEKGASTAVADHDEKTAYWYAKEHAWSTKADDSVDRPVGCGYSDVVHRKGHPLARQHLDDHYKAALERVAQKIERADHYDFGPHYRGEAEPPLEVMKKSQSFQQWKPKFDQWKSLFPDPDYLGRVLINADEKLELGAKPISEPDSHTIGLGILPVLMASAIFRDHAAQDDDRFQVKDG